MSAARPVPEWEPPQAVWDPQAARAWFRHGPIDLSIMIEGDNEAMRFCYAQAWRRFQTILQELSADLPSLRQAAQPGDVLPLSSVARRMELAASTHAGDVFVTPMAAVAGAVADELLYVILETSAASSKALTRVAVNNGGDIAVWLAAGQMFTVAMHDANGVGLGQLGLSSEHLPALIHAGAAGGVATSGWRGRSFSLGVADSVTTLANSAAAADAAATLIANAIDLPGHPGVRRQSAESLSPDSDLGARLVTVDVPDFTDQERRTALRAGLAPAEAMRTRGDILAAALFLGESAVHAGTALNALDLSSSQKAA